MKAFQFSLESLRTLRQQKERAAQQRYAKSLAACDDAARRLQAASRELASGWESVVLELASGAAAATIRQLQTWCAVLEARRNECKAALDDARRAAETAFREMVSAARDRDALDHFYERSRRSHERGVQQQEQKMFDEMAVQMNGSNALMQLAVND